MTPFIPPIPPVTIDEERRRQMAIFDDLPPEVRGALADAAHNRRPSDVAQELQRVRFPYWLAALREGERQSQRAYEAALLAGRGRW